MVWNGIIACYLFLAGLGAGSFVFAAIAGWKNPDAKKVKFIGMLIGLIAVAVGTLLLVVDAKAGFQNPARFFLLLSNPGSVMSWGTALLSIFLIVDFIELIIMKKKQCTPKALDWIGIVVSVGVAIYTGLLLGAAVGFPLWNIAILPILFLVSATSTGFAAACLGGRCASKDEMEPIVFHRKLTAWLPVVELALVALLLAVTASVGGSAAAAAGKSVAALLSGTYAVAFWGGLVIVGLCVPFAIELSARKKPLPSGAAVGAQICVLIGGFLLRYLIIMAAVSVVF